MSLRTQLTALCLCCVVLLVIYSLILRDVSKLETNSFGRVPVVPTCFIPAGWNVETRGSGDVAKNAEVTMKNPKLQHGRNNRREISTGKNTTSTETTYSMGVVVTQDQNHQQYARLTQVTNSVKSTRNPRTTKDKQKEPLHDQVTKDNRTSALGSMPSPSPYSETLPLFLQDIHPSPEVYNIYQIVTSKPDTLLMRHYCSLESFCHQNPNATVWFLFLDVLSLSGEPLRILRTLHNSYQNLVLARIELLRTVEGTPLKRILDDGRLNRSIYYINHLCDLLRLAVVAESGGLYADFDFICIRELTGVKNALALALPKQTMAGLYHFDAGHELMKLIMERDAAEFNSKGWGENGPLLFNRAFKDRCGAERFNSPTRIPNNDTRDVLDRTLDLIETQKDLTYADGDEVKIRSTVFYNTTRREERNSPQPATASSHSSWYGKDTKNNTNSSTATEEESPDNLCRSVTLLDTRAFMPHYLGGMKNLFKANTTVLLKKIPPEAFALHLFNHLTKKMAIEPSSGLDTIAHAYCPISYLISDKENKPL